MSEEPEIYEALPAYSKHEPVSPDPPPAYENTAAEPEAPECRVRPAIIGSSISEDRTTLTTRHPAYSKDAAFLETMIREQSTIPPTLCMQIVGTHYEGHEGNIRTDFDITIDLTYLLSPEEIYDGPETPALRARYRGTQPRLNLEQGNDFTFWCERYTSDSSIIKTIKFTQKIEYINFWFFSNGLLRDKILTTIRNTNYRGDIKINFNLTNNNIVIQSSPGFLDFCRTTWIIYIWFYVTCLWILIWPLLNSITTNYEVLTTEFYIPPSSTDHVYRYWKRSIKRAVLGRRTMLLDKSFRRAAEELPVSEWQHGPLEDSQSTILTRARFLGMDNGRPRYSAWGDNED